MTKREKWISIEENLEKIQARFLFAWEHTCYRANLVALRTELGLRDEIYLPCDDRPAPPPRPILASRWMRGES
jgi:hypothetical protein